MDLWDLSERDKVRTYDRLTRLRECLRPLSVEAEPSFEPVDEIWSANDTILHITPNVETLLGWDPGYVKRISPGLRLFRPGDIETTYPHWYRCLMGRHVQGVEFRLAHADGTGYVWLADDMRPRLRHPDGRVRDVHIRTYDVTALRARELDFVLDSLRLFHNCRERELLQDLGIPDLIDQLLPGTARHPGAMLLRFRKLNGKNAPAREAPALQPQPSVTSHSQRRQ